MSRSESYDRPKCSDVADKLSQIFGWRQTYNVEKLQKNVQDRDISRISIIRSNRPSEGSRSSFKEGAESWVAVRNLKSQGGGILDPDDRLSDVVDDREQIFVSFESDDGIHHHVGGDGASGSSDGTGSPELFKDFGRKYGYHKMHRCSTISRTDIEVTGSSLANGNQIVPTLQVRRGSEPNLTQIEQPQDTTIGLIRNNPISDHTKRWSAAALIVDSQSPQVPWQQEVNSSSIKKSPDMSKEHTDRFWKFSHDSMLQQGEITTSELTDLPRNNKTRLSMQFTTDGVGNNLAKAIQRTYDLKSKITSKSLPRDQKRKEPLGQANSATSSPTAAVELDLDRTEHIVIRNDTGPLGIHVIPDYDRHGKDKGLLIQGIDPDGRIYHDGRLALYDRIIEINGQSLLNLPFQRIQEMFKLSLISPELSLRIIKSESARSGKPPAPIYPRLCDNKENVTKLEGFKKSDNTNTKIATVSPTKKLATISRNQKSLLTVNTRKIGRKIELELTKAPPPHGLGFSITTRDNPAGGNCPIYIKNIIPKGAAVQDGRLKIGDRLLEVNDVEMTGKSQSEAVSVLRNVMAGSKVRIVVSRQEDVPNTDLPRIINADITVNPCVEPSHNDRTNNQSSYCAIHERNGFCESCNLNHCIQPPLQHFLQQQTQSRSTSNDVTKSVGHISNDIYSQPMDIYGDMSSFPWKHRQILTLDIPVHDSEKAGLGISVKGKTSGSEDLGIFIKSVIHGGAASRDQRLRTNDQLLNVNNISLLYQTNSDAMETLRKAMLHTEGPVPGNITLTIARKTPIHTLESRPHPGAFLNRSFHDYLSAVNQSDIPKMDKTANRSLDSNLIQDSMKEHNQYSMRNDDFSSHSKVRHKEDFQQSSSYTTGSTTEKSNGSSTTVIFNPKQCQFDVSMNTWNPVLDKLTGESNKQLRNESYYKATNQIDASTYVPSLETMSNHVIKTPFGETLLMEDEYGSRLSQPNISKSTLLGRTNQNLYYNLVSLKTSANAVMPTNSIIPLKSTSNTIHDIRRDSNKNITTIDEPSLTQEICSPTDVVYVSQLAIKNPPTGFSRDAFGRQSMSEKRHAALDAKTTDTYQRSKKMREKRGRSKGETDSHMVEELGPSLGMKKSSSLESLQTMVQETQIIDGDSALSYRCRLGGLGVFRGESCKATFRTAEKKTSSKMFVDPDHHIKISAKKHWLLDPPTDFNVDNGFDDMRGSPRQSSLNTVAAKPKHGKKKSGLLKGFGTIFR